MLENQQRKNLYRFFARIFNYPDHSLVEDLPAEAAAVAGLLAPDSPFSGSSPQLAELEISYTELFISRFGGVPAPPYGSVYLEAQGQLMGQTTLCALRAYKGEGLNHIVGGEPPDFIAIEMEFLYYLVEQEIETSGRGDLKVAQTARQKQGDFYRTLLQPWLPPFCQRIFQTEDAAPLYRWAAEMLIAFHQHEEVFYTES